jgi:preprotein translocase subunit SecA
MRIFGSESIEAMLKKFGFKENESIDHPWINKAIERAQQKVEARNFDIRKTLLKFDDVMNDQRHVIFGQRKEILASNNIEEIMDTFLNEICENYENEKQAPNKIHQSQSIKNKLKTFLGRSMNETEIDELINLKGEKFTKYIKERFDKKRNERIGILSLDGNKELEKRIFLQTLDFLWRAHLQYLEHLRQVIGLRSYGQKDPLVEFKKEAFALFEGLLQKIKIDIVTFLNNLSVVEKKEENKKTPNESKVMGQIASQKQKKTSRNAPCPCGSGKKYKRCCGAL